MEIIINEKAMFNSKYEDDAGYDVCAWQFGHFKEDSTGRNNFEPLDDDFVILETMDSIDIDLGIAINLKSLGLYRKETVIRAEVTGKSGLSSKRLLAFLGTIDEGYQSRIYACVTSLSKTPLKIDRYQKICQIVLSQVLKPKKILVVKNFVTQTERQDNGFGSDVKMRYRKVSEKDIELKLFKEISDTIFELSNTNQEFRLGSENLVTNIKVTKDNVDALMSKHKLYNKIIMIEKEVK